MSRGICWIDGKIVALDQATIPVTDHGLLYGDGIFEGIRFYRRKPFLLGEHLDRLRRSARAIALEYPWQDDALASIIEQLVARFHQPDGYIRLLITRGSGPLGINPASCDAPRLIVIADSLEMVSATHRRKGVKLITAATRRLPPNGLDPRIKSLNYLNHILARIEANAAGADEAILLNGEGHVAEGTADNIFIARDGLLLTPPPTDGALDGVTRRVVMRLAAGNGIDVKEATLASYDLYTADECFLTGTGAELIPVREINGRELPACPGPLFQNCQRLFEEFIAAETSEK